MGYVVLCQKRRDLIAELERGRMRERKDEWERERRGGGERERKGTEYWVSGEYKSEEEDGILGFT